MEEFRKLVDLMATLRGEQGCPWDRKQTEKSFRTFLLEEVYEAIDAIEKDDHAALKEELGDLLFHIVFIARICEEKNLFSIRDIVTSTFTKMYNRHPHVFPPAERQGHGARVRGQGKSDDASQRNSLLSAQSAREGEAGYPLAGGAPPLEGATQAPMIEPEEHENPKLHSDQSSTQMIQTKWEEIKKAEKPGYSLLSNVPKILPALLRAHVISKRAAHAGFDWEKLSDVHEKMAEEIAELKQAEGSGNAAQIEEEIGDLLFTIVNISRFHGVDPENALRLTIDKFVRRFNYIEEHLDLSKSNLSAMDALWNEIKNEEKRGR